MAKRSVDPSRTASILRPFLHEITQAFNELKREIHQAVVVQDLFGLNDTVPVTLVTNADGFKFNTSDEKLKQFQRWLAEQIKSKLLYSQSGTDKPWTDKYVHSAHRQGVVRAWTDVHNTEGELNKPAGFVEGSKAQFLRTAFARPERISKVKMAATRVYTELEGITATMSTRMSSIFANNIANGHGVKKISRELQEQVGIDKKRADRLARTEVINLHADGQLDGYEELAMDDLQVDAELLTAGEACPKCETAATKTYTIKEARGIIPLHPNCRCCWKPLTGLTKKKRAMKLAEAQKKRPGKGKKQDKAAMAPAAGLFGLQPVAVVRWMGANDWTIDEAKTALDASGVSLADATLKIQLKAGKTGTRGPAAELTADQIATLTARKTGGTIKPPPIGPPPVITIVPPPTPPKVTKLEPLVTIQDAIKAVPQPQWDATGSLVKPPKWITYTGEPTDVSRRVWKALGDGGGSAELYTNVGKIIREEMDKDPVVAKIKTQVTGAQEAKRKAQQSWAEVDQAYNKANQDLRADKSGEGPTRERLLAEVRRLGDLRGAANKSYMDSCGALGKLQTQEKAELKGAADRTLRQVRDFGGIKLNYEKGSDKSVIKALDTAADKLPADWMHAVSQHWLDAQKVDRGFFNANGASHGNAGSPPIVALSDDDKKTDPGMISVGMHELTHAVEALYRQEGFIKMGKPQGEFLTSRRKPNEQLEQIAGHGPDEVGYKDEFLEHYIGKQYPTGGFGGKNYYEVMTMGVEGALGARHCTYPDENLSHFVLGMLAGF